MLTVCQANPVACKCRNCHYVRSFLSLVTIQKLTQFFFILIFICVFLIWFCLLEPVVHSRALSYVVQRTQRHSSRFLFIRKFNCIRNNMQLHDAGSQRRVERKQIPVDRINFKSIYQLLEWIAQMIWHFRKLDSKAKSLFENTWLCIRFIKMPINHFVYLCWSKNSRTRIYVHSVQSANTAKARTCVAGRAEQIRIKKGEVNTRRMVNI